MRHHVSLHRVHVHVFQLFRQLPARPDVEIIKASLPEMLFGGMIAVPAFCEQCPRNALFQYLQDFRRIVFPRFGDEKMDVFRHDYVPDQSEGIFSTDLRQDGHEAIASPHGSEQGTPSETTEGDEVEITLSVAALQRITHGRKTRTLENRKGAAPDISQTEKWCTNDTLQRCWMGRECTTLILRPHHRKSSFEDE